MILKLVICSSQIIYHTNSLKWHLTTGGIRQIGKITVLGYTQPCLSSNTQNRLIVTEKSKHCQDWNFSPLNSLISLSGSRHHTHPGKCLAVETLDEKSNMNLEDCDQNSLLQQFSIDDTDGSLRPVHGDDEWCVMTTGKNGKQKLSSSSLCIDHVLKYDRNCESPASLQKWFYDVTTGMIYLNTIIDKNQTWPLCWQTDSIIPTNTSKISLAFCDKSSFYQRFRYDLKNGQVYTMYNDELEFGVWKRKLATRAELCLQEVSHVHFLTMGGCQSSSFGERMVKNILATTTIETSRIEEQQVPRPKFEFEDDDYHYFRKNDTVGLTDSKVQKREVLRTSFDYDESYYHEFL